VRILSFFIFTLLFSSCEKQLGDTNIRSISGKSYSQNTPDRFTLSLIKDLNTTSSNEVLDLSPSYYLVVEDGIFYSLYHPLFGDELYFWNEDSHSSQLVEDLEFGGDGSDPLNFKSTNDYLYFWGTTSNHGFELRRTSLLNPTYIETFDFVQGQGSVLSTNAFTDDKKYFVYNDTSVFIFDPNGDILAARLNTLNVINFSQTQSLTFTHTRGQKRIGKYVYFMGSSDNETTYYPYKISLTNGIIVQLTGTNYSVGSAFDEMIEVDGKLFIRGTPTSGANPALFHYDGSSLVKINIDTVYGSGNTRVISGTTTFKPGIYAGETKLFFIAENVTNSQRKTVALDVSDLISPSIDIINTSNVATTAYDKFFVVDDDNFCAISEHDVGFEDLVCYRGDSGDIWLIDTNENTDPNLGVIENDEAGYNGGAISMDTGNLVFRNGDAYFTALDQSAQVVFYKVDFSQPRPLVSNLGIVRTSGNSIYPYSKGESSHFVHFSDGSLANNHTYYDIDNDEFINTLQANLNIGDGVVNNSSNIRVIAEGENYIIYIDNENQLVDALPTSGTIKRLNKITGNIISSGLTFHFENPNSNQSAFVKYFNQGNSVLIEYDSLGNGFFLLEVDLITGDYKQYTQRDINIDPDFDQFTDLYEIDNKLIVLGNDNESPAGWKLLELNRANIKLDTLYTHTFGWKIKPILKKNSLYFPGQEKTGGSIEGIYKISNISNSLTVQTIGPSIVFGNIPNSTLIPFLGDDKYMYYAADIPSNTELRYISYDGLSTGVVGGSAIKNFALHKSKGNIFVYDPSNIYKIDSSGTTPTYTTESAFGDSRLFPAVGKSNIPLARVVDDGDLIKIQNGEVSVYATDYDQSACSGVDFTTTSADDYDFVSQNAVLVYRSNGAAASSLCFISNDDWEVDLSSSYGINDTSSVFINEVISNQDRVIYAITREVGTLKYKTEIYSFNLFNESIQILDTHFHEFNTGYNHSLKISSSEAVLCNENLMIVDIETNTVEEVKDNFICDSRTLFKSKKSIIMNGADRDDYVGFEPYELSTQ